MRPQMFNEMGKTLAVLVDEDVFGDQADPHGRPWKRVSPLTLKVREGQGQGGNTRLGGSALRKSFMIGGRGNIFKKRRNGFIYGTGLSKGSIGVGASFQDTYTMPSSPGGGAFDAPPAEEAQGRQDDAGARIRGFMGAVAGVYAPAPGNVLTHPGRQILDWSPEWIDEMRRIALKWMRIAVENVLFGGTAPQRVGSKPNTENRVAV